MTRWAGFLALSLMVGKIAWAEAPTLDGLMPAGGRRGSTVAVTLHGKFAWPVKVWSPGVQTQVSDESGKVTISIPEDLATDCVWIRVYNDAGASTLRPFLVGSLNEALETEPNNALRAAQQLDPAGTIVNGVLDPRGDVDSYAVNLDAGDTEAALARLAEGVDFITSPEALRVDSIPNNLGSPTEASIRNLPSVPNMFGD